MPIPLKLPKLPKMQDKAPLPARAAAKPKLAGRPPGRHPDETRERILDVAEKLFANNGYNGTSLRDVARGADLQTAAIGYHYPTKEGLFDTVIRRRAAVMTEWRQRALAEMRQRHGAAGHAVRVREPRGQHHGHGKDEPRPGRARAPL